MATKPAASQDSLNSSAPVIRRQKVTEEDVRQRLLKRQAPAWIVSGLVHIVLITGFILIDRLFKRDEQHAKDLKAATTNTRLDEPPPAPDDNVTIVDPGFDPELTPALDNIQNESDANILAPEIPDNAPGLPNQNTNVMPPFAAHPGASTESALLPGADSPFTEGNGPPIGHGILGNDLSVPAFGNRISGATKDKTLKREGGNEATERAVALGLTWLAKQQNAAGYWEFDGDSKADRVAATGMCLLPFLAAGETHVSGKKYQDNVARGLKWLKQQMKATGQFANGGNGVGMYSQPIATIALCEAAGMTQDKNLANVARQAVKFIVASQGDNGSWGYTANTNGDTSIVGWNIQALKSARLANLIVPDNAFKQAEAFLKSVSSDSEAAYGYRGPGATHTLTSVGLLCRQYMGWTPRNPSLARGVRTLVEKYPPQKNDWNIYYYYYASQVVHFFGGDDWHVKWNPAMRQLLLDLQTTEKTPGVKAADVGSWSKDSYFIGSNCGKLGTTALAVLTLEVYYRHLPLYKRDAGGLQELEK